MFEVAKRAEGDDVDQDDDEDVGEPDTGQKNEGVGPADV